MKNEKQCEVKCGPVSLTKRGAFLLGATALCLMTANIAAAQGPVPVHLGSAGTFAILSKTGVTDVYASAIVGDVGASPITGASILLSCPEVSGTIYSADAAGPAPCTVIDPVFLTSVVHDMQFAYDDAAGRVAPDFTELGAGEIGGLTLIPGLYKWATGLSISTDVTLSGGPDDVWIFQVEKLALLKIAFCKCPVFSRASEWPTSTFTSFGSAGLLSVISTDPRCDSVPDVVPLLS